MEDWSATLDGGNAVDVAYLNYAKAFDSVRHEATEQVKIVWCKREAAQLVGSLFDWSLPESRLPGV